jgi:endonuclease VIII
VTSEIIGVVSARLFDHADRCDGATVLRERSERPESIRSESTMSEGPEVRRTADRIAEALLGRTIETVELRKRGGGPVDGLVARVVGAKVKDVRTHGKHIVLAFTRGIYLHNHMMMWGKWRTYARAAFDAGKARPPPRVRWRSRGGSEREAPVRPVATDVRRDSRVRLVLATADTVAVEFNGPILRFSRTDPAKEPAIERLGPDALASRFPVAVVRRRLRERGGKKLADLLLDQTFVSGIGNKYKSEILFELGLPPFGRAEDLSADEERALIAEIRRTIRAGYEEAGRTRPLEKGEAANQWNFKHWVFRRSGRPCWRCGDRVRSDRSSSARVTYWCPTCQAEEAEATAALPKQA